MLNKVIKRLGGERITFRRLSENEMMSYEDEETSKHEDLVSFFKSNPNPSDDEVHALADEMGIDPHELEERVYKLLSELIKGVGKNNDAPDEEFDADELEMGIGIEMEHTDDRDIAEGIAKDHLSEIPDYYSRLKDMEGEAGVDHPVEDEEFCESITSEIGRKIRGRVSGKEHARSIGIDTLQFVERELHPKELRQMWDDMTEDQIDYLNKIRKHVIDRIKILKGIEK